MKQIGVDLCNLPEFDGFKYFIVCIDYFSKWSEQKVLKVNLCQLLQAFYMKSFAKRDVSKYK